MKFLPSLPLLSLVLFGILLSSCVKEPEWVTAPYEAQELYGEEYLQNYTTPEIMFHYVKVDEGWGNVEGLIIDRQGKISKYSLDELGFDLEEPSAPQDLVEAIRLGSVEQSSVDLHELVEHFKKTRTINRDYLQIDRSNPTDRVTHYLIAYDLHYPQDTCSNGSCPGTEPSETLVNQYILKAEGYLNGENSSVQAKQIAAWVQEVVSRF